MNPESLARRLGATALVASLMVAPSLAAAQTPSDDGRQLFQYGRTYYDQRRWAEALDAFRRSSDVLPSPNTRLYMGRCLRELGRNAEAWSELEDAAHDADERASQDSRYARTAETARQESGALADRVAFLVIEPPTQVSGVTVSVNSRAFRAERLGRLYAVEPGSITVDATASGYAPFHTTSTLAAGQQARVTITLSPVGAVTSMAPQTNAITVLSAGDRGALPVASVVPQQQRSPWRAVGVTAMSAGLVLGAIGIYTGLRVMSIREDLDARCGNGCGPNPSSDVLAQVDEGRNMALYTNILWGAGGALLVGGAIAFFASGGSAQELYAPTYARRTAPRLAPRATWSPFVDPAAGRAGVTGSF